MINAFLPDRSNRIRELVSKIQGCFWTGKNGSETVLFSDPEKVADILEKTMPYKAVSASNELAEVIGGLLSVAEQNGNNSYLFSCAAYMLENFNTETLGLRQGLQYAKDWIANNGPQEAMEEFLATLSAIAMALPALRCTKDTVQLCKDLAERMKKAPQDADQILSYAMTRLLMLESNRGYQNGWKAGMEQAADISEKAEFDCVGCCAKEIRSHMGKTK